MSLRSTGAAGEGVERPATGISEDDLQKILDSNRTIGVATGITMAEFGISRDAAHSYLVRLSQNSNLKLRDVAAIIVTDATISACRHTQNASR